MDCHWTYKKLPKGEFNKFGGTVIPDQRIDHVCDMCWKGSQSCKTNNSRCISDGKENPGCYRLSILTSPHVEKG